LTWLISIVVALLSAIAGGAAALGLSILAVEWYRVTSREGASGFAVLGLAIFGSAGSAVVGLIAARIGVANGYAGFGGQLLWSLGTCLTLLGLAGLVARALADVPPKRGGEEFDLQVELRYPPDVAEPPTDVDGKSNIELASLPRFRRVVRKRVRGELAFDQVRKEEGRWVLPGKVPVFTSRGRRILLVDLNGQSAGFLVPLPARPGQRETNWSGWLPRPQPQPNPLISPLTYRFRVESTPSD